MEFKFDTRSDLTIITPEVVSLNAEMAGELVDKCNDVRNEGVAHLIIDLQHCETIDDGAIAVLLDLHEASYNNDQSLVITEVKAGVMATLKKSETDLILNVAPKLIEAIDIVSMEILERDLLADE